MREHNKMSTKFEFPEIRTDFDAVSKRFEEGELAAKLASIFDSEEVKAKMSELEGFADDISEELKCSKEELLKGCAIRQNVMNNAMYEALTKLSTNPECWDLKALMLEAMSVEKAVCIIEGVTYELMNSIIGHTMVDEIITMLEDIFGNED